MMFVSFRLIKEEGEGVIVICGDELVMLIDRGWARQ
jgi:hypothetical protein